MTFKKDYKVENVVASVVLHADIPLEKVAYKLTHTEYNPEQFPGLVLRLLGEGITALVFSSGNIVCTGAKSVERVGVAVKMIIKELEKVDIKITKEPVITIQNMVASGDIGEKLNLTELAFKLKTAEYEPEQFPGLVYKVPKDHITFLLFGTGKIVCTGAKNDGEINKAVDELIKELKRIMKPKKGKNQEPKETTKPEKGKKPELKGIAKPKKGKKPAKETKK
jgi:transcription initiation factor TFIID TATA-box-binding protein